MNDDAEIVSIPPDQRGGNLPARLRGNDPRGPAIWSAQPAQVYGQFPKGFVPWACRAMGARRETVLHVCCGSLELDEGALRVDLMRDRLPDIVADGRALPLRSACAEAVILDPPYSEEYAEELYGTDYPRPSRLLAEAARVARPGAPIGFLHVLVPASPPGCTIENVYGVTTGVGYRIRAFTIYRKTPAGLFDELADEIVSIPPRGGSTS